MSQPMPYTPWSHKHDQEYYRRLQYVPQDEPKDWLYDFEVDLDAQKKRLTNEQCAAEYWRLKADLCGFGVVTDSPVEIARKATTMHRFATTPHAFEVDDG